ncbi:hypothetical protein C806_02938 [Lachnospiraceae bacterium 3-1]|nr:hypothetical protein C806_02938 [Lachnospiraceae bacterium 3-1]
MNRINVNEKYRMYSTFSAFEKGLYQNHIYDFLKRLNIEYPGFSKWYKRLFVGKNELQNGREIIICEKDYRIAGVAILKSTEGEKKICTLRVAAPFQRQGIGKELMEMSFEWLQEDKPLITMHKSKQHEFAALLEYYGFVLEQTQWNYYNIFSTELSYNGILPEKKIFFNKIEIKDIDNWYKSFIMSGNNNIKEFLEECIEKWYQREQKRRREILTY